ncbi:MAG: SDR family NAD(P)-dependent oxidoreductase [Planctomycetota bacterium]|nr:MAG: SDR family NAD(P)-dependent oxidoreductase [Planctomycetota bacterium]REJ86404.1 MAG: SDR family NAD(P)-dependent oxidoreductase [Planctomycetota bacterium]REK30759.1 MAG: SDR family NAD(P)-dependent oxidoreductase [Planctomycetota bacterium]REK33134.1 MAG: SDR family NAD(P)-dependent oxidoreductase [Planctomycetota bacterium]
MSNFIIFGATGGLGAELSRRLVDRGHQVCLAGRSVEKLQQLAAELAIPSVPFDAEKPDTIQEAFSSAEETLGTLDGAVNAVGSVLLKPAHLTSHDEFLEVMQVNLGSSFAVVREAARRMRKRGGSVVLVSSSAARIGMPNHESIAAAKAGIEGLARSAAATYAAKGIRFNVIAPGLVQTEMTRSIWSSEPAAAASRAMHSLGRLGTPEDIASCAEWLLDSKNSWVTGQVIAVDGGLSTVMAKKRSS